jgi:4-hydroxy-3-methylbut-2-enyl diphosphate reductase
MDTTEFRSGAEQLSESQQQTETAASEEHTPAGSQAEMEAQVSPLASGQIVEGLIVHIDEQGALVDVGTKSEGHISREELADGTTDEGKPLAVGDRIAVYVVRPEDEEGNPVLSKKRADYERVWRRVIEAHETGEVLTGMVVDRVKGGLVVDLGLRGFLPASHVRTRNVHALDRFIGQSLKVKIVEVDRARKRVVVSHKNAVEEEREKRRKRTLESLEENKIYRGVVRRITDYGAFVDLGGVDGLLHVTEMSWTRVNHPREVVQVGDKIDVMVLRYDRQQNRISLGLKQILPDPWEEVPRSYKVGQIATGTVTRVVPFGAFVKLEGTGIEGIIPNAELPGERGKKAADVLTAGEKVDVKIVNIRSSERRMTLSLRQFEQAKERQQLKDYMQRQEDSSRVTIGDLFGSVLANAQAARQQAEPEAASAPSEGAGEPMEELGPAAVGEQLADDQGLGGGEQEAEEDSASLEPVRQAQGGGAAHSSSESPAESEAARD